MGDVTRRKFAKLEEVSEVVGLSIVPKLFSQTRNLHETYVPHGRMTCDLVRAFASRKGHIKDHRRTRGLRIRASQAVSAHSTYIVPYDTRRFQFEGRSELVSRVSQTRR